MVSSLYLLYIDFCVTTMASFPAHPHRTAVVLPFVAALSLAINTSVEARSLVGGPVSTSSSTSNAPSTQTTTAATTAAAQAAQAAASARRAQDSLVRSTAAFQSLAAAQAAAHAAAVNSASNIITSSDGINTDGLGAGLLNPLGGMTAPQTAAAIQLIDLGTSGKNQIVLSNGGSVTLPKGTSGDRSSHGIRFGQRDHDLWHGLDRRGQPDDIDRRNAGDDHHHERDDFSHRRQRHVECDHLLHDQFDLGREPLPCLRPRAAAR